MSILYVGIDLAKNVFAVRGVNEAEGDSVSDARSTCGRHEVAHNLQALGGELPGP